MHAPSRSSATHVAAASLRALSQSADEGELLGSESAIVSLLGVSRSTVRQVARLVEREGWLRVRRGVNGGYFAARPTLEAVEAAMGAYLTAISVPLQDITSMASALWAEVMRKAARQDREKVRPFVDHFTAAVSALAPDASFDEVLAVERQSQQAIFELTGSSYIQLIFHINTLFALKNFTTDIVDEEAKSHRRFVQAWRSAKQLELASIMDGDEQLTTMAARHLRNVWDSRVWRVARHAHDGGETDA